MNPNQLNQKRSWIKGKFIVGIDPAKDKHQAAIVDCYGDFIGKSFCFSHNATGFHEQLWFKLKRYLESEVIHPDRLVFAVEAAVDFWQPLVNYLHRQGYSVVIVSPLTTKKSRALPGHDFSRTDPKDARLVAESAFRGHFSHFLDYSDQIKAMKTLSLTYNKLRKDLSRNYLRLRSIINRVFPEFLSIVPLDTETALYLLKDHLHPRDFLELDMNNTAEAIMTISQKQHGMETLIALQHAAKSSIGIPRKALEVISDRLTVDSCFAMIFTLKEQIEKVAKKLIELAKQTPWFNILTSIKGISDLTTALFLAETHNLSNFTHYKQIQKMAGLNLRLNDSGRSHGKHKINRIGNRRLRWIIYMMTKETAKYIPEVRIKYLKRQIKQSCYTRNIIASTSQLLQLIMALIKENRTYEYRSENQLIVLELEHQYALKKKNKKNKAKFTIAPLTV